MYQMVRLTQEVTYNTYPSSPAMGTQIDVFLPVSNAQTVRANPQFFTIRDAGVGNRPIRKQTGRVVVAGSLQTFLFPSQAGFFLGLASGLTGTGPCYDLPSFTIDHVIYAAGCAAIYRRYTGNKIAKLSLTADQSDGGFLAMLKMDIVGSTPASITGTDFPVQAYSAYPVDNPYEFFQLAGNFTVGTSRTNFQAMNLDITNMVKSFPDENIYVQNVGWFGRDITLNTKLLYKSASDRTAYEAGTKQAVSAEFNNGTHTLTLNLQGQNNIDSVEDDLPLDDYYTQALSLSALMDPASTSGPGSTPTDFSYAVT